MAAPFFTTITAMGPSQMLPLKQVSPMRASGQRVQDGSTTTRMDGSTWSLLTILSGVRKTIYGAENVLRDTARIATLITTKVRRLSSIITTMTAHLPT